MTDWTGSLTPIVVTPVTTQCIEYLTVADLRAEYGEDIEDVTDAALQRQIDQMSAYLEDQVGHTFGRALIARSVGSDVVQVTATALLIGSDTYLFATYPTLNELVTAVNAAGENYSLELLPNVRSDTPSVLLKAHSSTACGPDYENRVILCASAMYCLLTGKYESHLFLPLNLAAVNTVVENLVVLTTSDYWALAGESWLIRKACDCGGCSCQHPKGRWSNAYPGNIGVSFVPQFWGRVPSTLSAVMLDAFSSRGGLAPYQSEDFGDYAYKRGTAPVASWQETLGGSTVRKYAVKFQP